MKEASKNTKVIILYIAITMALTWLLQFMPLFEILDSSFIPDILKNI